MNRSARVGVKSILLRIQGEVRAEARSVRTEPRNASHAGGITAKMVESGASWTSRQASTKEAALSVNHPFTSNHKQTWRISIQNGTMASPSSHTQMDLPGSARSRRRNQSSQRLISPPYWMAETNARKSPRWIRKVASEGTEISEEGTLSAAWISRSVSRTCAIGICPQKSATQRERMAVWTRYNELQRNRKTGELRCPSFSTSSRSARSEACAGSVMVSTSSKMTNLRVTPGQEVCVN